MRRLFGAFDFAGEREQLKKGLQHYRELGVERHP